MKVNIWIKKTDAISGNITEYHSYIPQVSYNNYVQVSISTDEFARLEDNNDWDSDYWIVQQYNRNRLPVEQVKSKEDIPHVYERYPNTGEVKEVSAKENKDTKNETAIQKIGERDYSVEKGLEQLTIEMKKKSSSQFTDWFHKLTKNEQTKLAAYYND